MKPRIPDSKIVREANKLVWEALPEAIYNHSLRAFFLGQAYAEHKEIDVSQDDFFLAAAFHDVGLVTQPSESIPFTELSVRELDRFLKGKGISAKRVAPMREAILRHFELQPNWQAGPMAGLLQVGAWMDLTGRKRWQVRTQAAEIARVYPRAMIDLKFPVFLFRTFRSVDCCTRLFVAREATT